jgi:hypothetical protein
MNKMTLRINLKGLFFVALLTASNLVFAQANTNCQALVNLRNDLWLMKPDGSNRLRLTLDGKIKSAAKLSTDQKMIAYSGESPLQDVMLISLAGGLLAGANLHIAGGVVGLSWLQPDLLRVDEHLDPNNSTFHFVEIPAGGLYPRPLLGLPMTQGISCAPAKNYQQMACVISDSVSVNDRDIFYVTNPFASALELQAVNLPIGRAINTATIPSFRLEAIESAEDAITLKVSSNNGSEVTELLSENETMQVPVIEGNATTMYGFMRTSRRGRDAISVRVLKSKTGMFSLAGNIAWSPNNRRIAVVEKNENGESFLILLNQGNSESDGEQHPSVTNAKIGMFRELLPISSPIKSIRFTSDTHIRIEGASQIYERDIPGYGKIQPRTNYTVTAAQPNQIMLDGKSIQVIDWVCP